jgi:hypothetical protein
MHPNSVDADYELNEMSQAYLHNAESFTVALNNIRIEVVDVQQGSSIKVDVDYL